MSYIKLQRAIATNNLSWAMRLHYRKTFRCTVSQIIDALTY